MELGKIKVEGVPAIFNEKLVTVLYGNVDKFREVLLKNMKFYRERDSKKMNVKILETLEGYNARRSEEYLKITDEMNRLKSNGIACPKCSFDKKENSLYDTKPDEFMACFPPTKRIQCIVCGFKGHRIA